MTTVESTDGFLASVLRREGVRQFVKFCIVGASSTLIDFTIYLFLIERVHLQDTVGSLTLARPLAQAISFLFAVTNGFIWNSRWTFRKVAPAPRGHHRRYGKFVLTNVVGLGLNLLILNVVAHLAPPALTALLASHLHDPAGFIGKVCATAVVVFWNFMASKYWTFSR